MENTPEQIVKPPEHVAIIMDGNGRWAAQRGLPRIEGHRKGVQAFRRAIEAADSIGIKYLTVYSFSSENWRRPKQEVADLMMLLKFFINTDLEKLNRNNVKIRIIGDRVALSEDIRALLDKAENTTTHNTGLNLVVAFNYGGRQEIVSAVRAIAEKVANNDLELSSITEDLLSNHLDTRGIPDPDLLIRTSGEQRISNFLTWQLCYTEFVFIQDYWPEFTKETLIRAINEFSQRERRFGAVGPRQQEE
jgi:undecaprenyl diphosphate synthase